LTQSASHNTFTSSSGRPFAASAVDVGDNARDSARETPSAARANFDCNDDEDDEAVCSFLLLISSFLVVDEK